MHGKCFDRTFIIGYAYKGFSILIGEQVNTVDFSEKPHFRAVFQLYGIRRLFVFDFHLKLHRHKLTN